MQNLVQIYDDNKALLEKFIISTVERFYITEASATSFHILMNAFKSLELMYACDEDFVQISANINKTGEDMGQIGKNRAYLLKTKEFTDSYYVSEPYISSSSGNLCVTVVHAYGDGYIFLDFRLRILLERFHLIEAQTIFRKLSRLSYFFIGGGILVLGLFIAFYGFGSFITYLFSNQGMSLEVVFKPVIALTLGLAVFDLGKTIFEQEVLPRTQHISDVFNPKSLITFMSSIMIALLIEALLIVFKISINNYGDLPYAAMLIAAIAVLLFVFSRFITSNTKKAE